MAYRVDNIATMVLKRINHNHFLPAIQRGFIWGLQEANAPFYTHMRSNP